MQYLSFETCNDTGTAEVVRHVHDPHADCTRTVTLGSIPITADPEDFFHELSLREGVSLDEYDYWAIADFLANDGDAIAARRRQEAAWQIDDELVDLLYKQVQGRGNALERAAHALGEACVALQELAQQASHDGRDVGEVLRPAYVDVCRMWSQFQVVAQAAVVEKVDIRPAKTN